MKKKEVKEVETQTFTAVIPHTGDDEVKKAQDAIKEQAEGYELGEFSIQSAVDVYTRTINYIVTATGTK